MKSTRGTNSAKWTSYFGAAPYVDDRVLLLYDVQTRKRVRTLAFPVYPSDSKDVPNQEIP